MKKEDKITLIVFITLVIAILLVVGINAYKTKKLDNVDRKVEYIMGYTYDDILNKGENLFLDTVELFKDKDVFEYVLDLNEKVRYYSINKKHNYVKITNFSIATNNFSRNTLNDYMEYKKIIHFENSYYMENEKISKSNYIGSMLDIDSYDDKQVIFKSTDYYCEERDYIGIIYEEPECDYIKKESKFYMINEGNIFKVNDIDNFKEYM